jgi:transaldolase
MEGKLDAKLTFSGSVKAKPESMTEAQFRWDHNEDPMATLKLAEGIKNFAIDQVKLETLLVKKL